MSESTHTEWASPCPISSLRSEELSEAGVVFQCGEHLYRSTGKELGQGGMGAAYLLARRELDGGQTQAVVGKVFHNDYLLQLRTCEVSKHEHGLVMKNLEKLGSIGHPHILPIYLATKIANNYLIISPLRSITLREAIVTKSLTVRRRVELLIQAISGLEEIHRQGFLHRDFTLRNILLDEKLENACLFDFDLILRVSEDKKVDYKTRFQGRIFGSPGYSLAPETLDENLMSSPVNASLDMYGVGTAIFSLFTEELPYGHVEDMWSLMLRVSEGVVRGGHSTIVYPEHIPTALREIIESCMQHVPSLRPQSAAEVISLLEKALPLLSRSERRTSSFGATMQYGKAIMRQSPEELLVRSEHDASSKQLESIRYILQKQGYLVQKIQGQVKGNTIYLVKADPFLVSLGRFPDTNEYPKIVTALNLENFPNRMKWVQQWVHEFLPALRKARKGLLTTLHRVIYDAEHGYLLLLSEFVENARFGPQLDEHDLELKESLSLAYLVCGQISQYHENGIAHNNICAEALLLKCNPGARRVHPAMIGIVEPSTNPEDMVKDVQRLAGLVLEWISDEMVKSAEPVVKLRVESVQRELLAISQGAKKRCTIREISQLCGDGLSALDFNFGVLRENGGDLEAYTLVLVSHSLYGRLWG